MQGFKTVLLEDRNTHLEHLEDEIINNGSSGARTSIEFLKSIKKTQKKFTENFITKTNN